MIKFFRNDRQKLAAENKVVAYSRYAVGEIILVVIGILIALQVNNWNNENKELRTLKGHLIYILEDLNSDKAQIDSLIVLRTSSIEKSTTIINSYKNSEPINSLDFLEALYSIIAEKHFVRNSVGFDRVKSSKAFESERYIKIRKLIRDYEKMIDEIKARESKQNVATEHLETELLANGFYNSAWEFLRAYDKPSKYSFPDSEFDFVSALKEINELNAIFLRNEWVMPKLVHEYKALIQIGEELETEIESELFNK